MQPHQPGPGPGHPADADANTRAVVAQALAQGRQPMEVVNHLTAHGYPEDHAWEVVYAVRDQTRRVTAQQMGHAEPGPQGMAAAPAYQNPALAAAGPPADPVTGKTPRLRVDADTHKRLGQTTGLLVLLAFVFAISAYFDVTQVDQLADAERAALDEQAALGAPANALAADRAALELVVLVVKTVAIGLVVAFVVLAFLSRVLPMVSAILGLVLYAGIHVVLYLLIGPESLKGGLIFKILIVAGLISGIGAAAEYHKAVRRYKRELARASVSPDW